MKVLVCSLGSSVVSPPAVRLLSAKPGGVRENGCWSSSNPFLPGKQAGLRLLLCLSLFHSRAGELEQMVAGGLAVFSAWRGEGQVNANVTP